MQNMITKALALAMLFFAFSSAPLSAAAPDKASGDERQALNQLAEQIEGAMIYTRRGKVRKVTIGDWREVDLGDGDFARWGPLGQRIAVQRRGKVYVMNTDGSNRREVVDGGVEGGDGCMIEFHTNGREIIYGTRRNGLWTANIESREKRKLNLPFSSEINISADGRHLVARRGDCYLVELPGTKSRKYAGGCSPCLSPDGTRMTSNKGGHRTMDIREWNGKKLFEINANDMRPDRKWDNMSWSNHDDYIVMQGDGRNDESYIFSVSKNKGWRMSWEGRTRYPDLFVAKDLKSGKSPMHMTLAWKASGGDVSKIASSKPARKAETKPKTKPETKAVAKADKAKPVSNKMAQRAAEVRGLTGEATRIVWCQSLKGAGDYCAIKKGTQLWGFCTEDGKGERMIRGDVTSYAKPIFTPDGQRIVYSDRTNNKIYVVNWDGSGHRELGSGYASDIWRDPADGREWLYYRAGNGRTKGGVMRQLLDTPSVREKVWDKTPTGHELVPWFRLSANGTHAATAFPWSTCGVADLTNGSWDKYGGGCWSSMAPDNSYRYFNFNGSHKDIAFFDAGKRNRRNINVAGGPGVGRSQVYHPRWSNHVRFLTVTGPKGGDKQEVLLGRFNKSFTKVESWVQISHNNKPDFYGDAWIASGWRAKLNGKEARQAQQLASQSKAKPTSKPVPNKVAKTDEQKDMSAFKTWPGDAKGLQFLWENNNATNQIASADRQSSRLCRAVATGNAVFGRHYEMDLVGGAVVAEEIDDDLLAACKRSNELTIEATITTADVDQDGPARIVSFSDGTSSRNFTLCQDDDKLVMRLRTTKTGKQGDNPRLDLLRLQAGRPYHVVVTYSPGRMSCYIDGKRVLDSDRVKGDFGNWERMHLLFGDEWKGERNWDGLLEGVAIYSRAVPKVEAEHKYKLYATKLRDRKPADRVIVAGKLVEITPTPEVAELQEYSRGIVVYGYEIENVISGREEAEKIQVAHWALLDRKSVASLAGREVGKTYRLTLEKFNQHPQLESERTFNDCEDFDVPLYYDVAGRGREGTALAGHASQLAGSDRTSSDRNNKAPKVHLKVNCGGPSIDDWKSDEAYVVRDGGEYRFRSKCNVSSVSQPAPEVVYQTCRHQEHAYEFDVPDGEYVVRMHFMDEHDPAGKIRKMDFVIEGDRPLRNFNVVSAAGGRGRAIVREISVRVSDGNGLQIEGEEPRGGDVFVSAIEILSR